MNIVAGLRSFPFTDELLLEPRVVLIFGAKFEKLSAILLYFETNFLHVLSSSCSMIINKLLCSVDPIHSIDTVDIFTSLNCADFHVMSSRETVPSLNKIATRLTASLREQQRKIVTSLVDIRKHETPFQRVSVPPPSSPRKVLVRNGRLRLSSQSLTMAFFLSSFNDPDWISLVADRFDLTFSEHGEQISPRIYETVRFVCAKLY